MFVGNLGILTQLIHYKSILNDITCFFNCQEHFPKNIKKNIVSLRRLRYDKQNAPTIVRI